MREIKFRAWWPGVKRMKFFVMGNFEDTPEGWAMTFVQENEPHSIFLGKAELMQFTGLKDKNGKEIYEGDIVTFIKGYVDDTWTDTEQGCPYVIKWQETSVSFKAIRDNKEITPLCGQEGKYKWQWEVIGNIYENPELLSA